jgi:outer membrane receptor protein involved in Fe transport
MRKSALRTCASVFSLAVFAVSAVPALAQTAAAAPAAEEEDAGQIVVTASGGDKRQLDTSVSVTSVDAELIAQFKPSSEAEIFRMIPGIQVPGTSGPGGNSNIAVRGLPVATGGSPFVQLQEDGLPTVLFGDIQFGNNDYWTHFDQSVERVESVRGGGATTYASQAPGAVINYISNTGRVAGGSIGISSGINFNEQRVDFRYGAPLGENTRFHIGGYGKLGRGPLHADFRVSESFQVKANLTQDFADGNGFFRVLVKVADTQEPNYTGAPALATLSGTTFGNVQPFPGFDGRNSSNYSIYNQDFVIRNRAGVLERVEMSGITTSSFSLGGQLHYETGGGITFDNNMRWTSQSGAFTSPFSNVTTPAGIVGSTLSLNGTAYATVGSIRYANGPRAGQTFTGAYVDNNVNVRTNIRDIGSLANDFTLSGKFDMGGARVTARAGFFYMKQDIAMDWHVNKSLREVSGDNPAQLDLYSTTGAKLTFEGQSGYNNNWGSCCARDYDLSYTNTAPYAALELDSDHFAIDGSVRFERISASGGGTQGGATEFFVSSGGVNIPAISSSSAAERLDYSRSYVSWTAGALFKASANTSLFVRASRGGRFNGDRQTFGGKFHATGSTIGALCTSAQTELRNSAGVVTRAAQFGCGSDGVTPSVDFVNQYELGMKARGSFASGGRYSLDVTLFKGNFKQSTFELSATRCPGGAGGCVIDARYRSYGMEFYGNISTGGFNLVANATWSKPERSGTGATGAPTPFTRAPYLPTLSYTVQASYDVGEMVTIGANVTGQSAILDDAGRTYPGGAVIGLDLRVRPVANLELGIQGYNVFNRYDLRGSGNLAVAGNPAVIGTGPALGRTWTASVKYSF